MSELLQPTCAARALLPTLRFVSERDASIAPLILGDAGVDPSALGDIDHRLSAWALPRLLDAAAERLEDPNLGLHVAEWMATQGQTLDVYSYVIATSPTWGHALQRAYKYVRLVSDLHYYELEVEGDVAVNRLLDRVPFERVHRQLKEYVIAINWAHPKEWAVGEWTPAFVAFRHEAPNDTSEHERLFGCEVRFGASENAIGLPKGMLEAPLRQRDAELSSVMDRFAGELLERLPELDDLMARARTEVWRLVREGDASADGLAEALGMSPRTLHRRLTDIGTSYQRLHDEVRYVEAQWMLQRPGMTVSEVAFLLGFSEPAAFSRAFKRWAGESPGAYRERAR